MERGEGRDRAAEGESLAQAEDRPACIGPIEATLTPRVLGDKAMDSLGERRRFRTQELRLLQGGNDMDIKLAYRP